MRSFLVWLVFAGAATACSSTSVPPPSAGDSQGAAPVTPPGPGASTNDTPDAGSTPGLPAEWGADKCPALPSGATAGLVTGNQLGKLVVKDCDGNDVSLDQFCGASALWIFAAHGWCPHCQLVSKNAEAIHASFAGRNLASVNILVENASYETPTAQDCKAWKTANKLQNVVALYDPKGATRGLWDNNTTSLSVFVDAHRVIVAKSHTDSTSVLKTSIEKALTP